MKVSIRKALIEEKPKIISLFNYYMYEFSDILNSELPETGCYLRNTELIDHYWLEENHTPYFIEVDSEITGFVFVRKFPIEQDTWDIDQFFVLKRYARQGIGSLAFKLCIKAHAGKWIVRVLKENKRGLKFWQSAISSHVKGSIQHSFELDLGVEMHFFRFSTNHQ